MSRHPMVVYARRLQRRGWPVLPLDGKRPITPHGVHDATTDEEQAAEWWEANPEANVGLAAGHGIVVLDVDPRNGGDESLAKLVERYGELPPTVKVRTGGGGSHYYFAANGDAPSNGDVGPGLEFKAAGTYVVAPPSLHPDTGKQYKWLAGPSKNEVAPLPSCIATELSRRPHVQMSAQVERVEEGGRDNWLISRAGAMVRVGLTVPEMEATLSALNDSRCDPPLSAKDIRRIAKSAGRYAAGAEGQALVARTPDLSRARPPRWAWQDRIVVGYLNLLLGGEGVGKGTLAAWLIARLSRGELAGDFLGKPVCVAVLGDEDSFDDVWTPRLEAAGADFEYVVQLERPDGGFISLKEDRERLRDLIQEREIRVIWLDQLLDNLGVGVDDWRAKPVREALQPARSLAREMEVAFVGSLHPNKRGNSFRELVSGSHAFNAVSRSSLLLAQDPDNEGGRVLVRGKGNLSGTPRAIQFQIGSYRFEHHGEVFTGPLATDFEDGGDITVDDLIAAERPQRQQTKVGAVEDLIAELLPHDGEWHPARPIYDACAEQGYNERTVRRAAHDSLQLEHRREGSFKASAEWRWPTPATHGPSGAGVQSGQCVRSANTPANTTQDTPDTADTPTRGRSGGRSAKRGRS